MKDFSGPSVKVISSAYLQRHRQSDELCRVLVFQQETKPALTYP